MSDHAADFVSPATRLNNQETIISSEGEDVENLNHHPEKEIFFAVNLTSAADCSHAVDFCHAGNEENVNSGSFESEHLKDTNDDRVNWGTKADFLLSVIGYAVDLGELTQYTES